MGLHLAIARCGPCMHLAKVFFTLYSASVKNGVYDTGQDFLKGGSESGGRS